MSASLGCDMHKEYSVFCMIDEEGEVHEPRRVSHREGKLADYLSKLPSGSEVAVEACGGWYQVVDTMEEAGVTPRLANPRLAKLLMGMTNKTDKLDAEGLATLLLTGALPEVWIPPRQVRDRRELLRLRMKLVRTRTGYKNRVHATLHKYGLRIAGSDLFGNQAQQALEEQLHRLPEEHRRAVQLQQDLIGRLDEWIEEVTRRVRQVVAQTPGMKRLTSAPGIGEILAAVIKLEVGDVNRFPRAANLASYAGCVPRIHASGGKVRHGKTRVDVNHYLKWAYGEAANTVAACRRAWSDRHVARLYQRLRTKRNHGIAAGAVSRHLAEATWHILKKEVSYREPHTTQTHS